MNKVLLIDGNSIMNRAFYGIMGSKMLTTSDGTYTNGVYGFLAILFKTLTDVNPDYIVVAFDLKAPTFRHIKYSEYKATRKGMPEELVIQMPIIKDVLRAMNIKIVEQEGYEADDVIGTIAKTADGKGIETIILSGDRDNFQLINNNITVKIPRTKMGKTETEDMTIERIVNEYGLQPCKLIEVKGLMGDASDNIPGIPGVGEKTAISLIKEYNSIDELYKNIEEKTDKLKGKSRNKIIENRDLAYLSRELGTICTNAPLEIDFEDIKIKEYDKPNLYELFKWLNFNKYIEKLELSSNIKTSNIDNLSDIINTQKKTINIDDEQEINKILNKVNQKSELCFYMENINAMSIYLENQLYYIKIEDRQIDKFKKLFKSFFENDKIMKISYKIKEIYILLKNIDIQAKNMMFDIEIAAYILNPSKSKYQIDELAYEYLGIDLNTILLNNQENSQLQQINLFDENIDDKTKEIDVLCNYVYLINGLYKVLKKELEDKNQLELFNNIEMPLTGVLAGLQFIGVHVDKQALNNYGKNLKERIEILTKEIYNLCGTEFNINSTKQLGEILFEKLGLPSIKKTKTGYSTDVDVLEKIKNEHAVIEKLLEYRQIVKLNSTYVEGLLPLINESTNRIHSKFNQTVTSTGRISSTEPNLQNIPVREELGRELRKVFTASDGYVLMDADYSQIELRVLAHISNDTNMIEAFLHDEDIHTATASQVFNIPKEQITKELRSNAKAVNFGIVYGISDFGLAGNIGISRKEAKQYIDSYLEKYSGVKEFMDTIVKKAEEDGYVDTLFNRRRYIPEMKSSNYNVRQFGHRVALNTPIQGTAADIIKIAMINVYDELNRRNLKSKLILQVHDELIIEALKEEIEEVEVILKNCMENAINLSVPLKVDVIIGDNWYETK